MKKNDKLPRLLNGAEIIVMFRLRGIRSAGHVHARELCHMCTNVWLGTLKGRHYLEDRSAEGIKY